MGFDLSDFKEIVISLAAAVTAYSAYRGVATWKHELHGKAHFETARNLIRSTYKLRDEILICRSPLISANEFPENYSPLSNDNTCNSKGDAYLFVYKNRWEPVSVAVQQFQTNSLEAEVLLNKSIKGQTDKLLEAVKKLNLAIDAIIRNEYSSNRDFADLGFAQKTRATAYATSIDDDELTKDINNAINSIETSVKNYLPQ